jgi:hypothetical protein
MALLFAVSTLGAQGGSRVFVVVFDDQHLTSGGLKRLQTAAASLFTDQLQPGDRGGVVVDGQLVASRLLDDRGELLKAVARAHPRLATASDLEASTAIPGGVEPSARLAEVDRLEAARAAMDRQLSIVETLVGNLARVDGPKAVVLLSEGFGGDGATPRVRSIVAASVRAGVRFHVLDESGNDRDVASALARGTGGVIGRKAASFAVAIAEIGRETVEPTPAPASPAPATAAPGATSSASGAPASPTPAPAEKPEDSAATSANAAGVIVAEPTADPSVLRVRPLVQDNVMNLAGGDWSDTAAKAGWDAYQRGDVEAARAALAPAAARPGAASWIRYVLGQADYALNNFKEAADAWERVRARQPQFEPVYFDLADDYVKLNDRKKAIDVLRVARQRWPRDGEVLNALGVIQAGGGDLDAAIKVLTEATAIAPAESIGYLNLAKAFELRYAKRIRNRRITGLSSSDDADRGNALRSYERYLELNGPYADLAREGIARLK